MTDPIDLLTHNKAAWNRQAAQGCAWSAPVSAEEIANARAGNWSAARLTPGPLPAGWLEQVRGRRILCLAAGGGQQAPILAAAGADVTVFDFSEGQLDQDRKVAAREGLDLRCMQGDMRDLSVFADASFDVIFHPISNLYIPDVRPVWRECARVLAPQGELLSSFWNPVVFVADRDPALTAQGLVRPNRRLPYSRYCALVRGRPGRQARARRGPGVRPYAGRPDWRPAACGRGPHRRPRRLAAPSAFCGRERDADVYGYKGDEAQLIKLRHPPAIEDQGPKLKTASTPTKHSPPQTQTH